MSPAAPADEHERDLLDRARAGDRDAFALLVAPYRRGLHVHCYRLLGSLQDAEDLLQESLLRAWRRLGGFEGRSSLRAWLYRIATNACLDVLKQRRRRLLPDAYASPDDPTATPAPALQEVPWIEPYPDEPAAADDGDPAHRYELREAIELSFVTAVQLLPPRQRAVLILRDALGFSARETATMLGASAASVNSALARARAALAGAPRIRHEPPGPTAEAKLVARYVRAWEEADIDGLVALLREDARMTMPPTPSWYDGRDAIGAFFATFLGSELGAGSTLQPTRANRQPALIVDARDSAPGVRHPLGVKVLTLDGAGRIAAITGFTDPGLFPFFGVAPARALQPALRR